MILIVETTSFGRSVVDQIASKSLPLLIFKLEPPPTTTSLTCPIARQALDFGEQVFSASDEKGVCVAVALVNLRSSKAVQVQLALEAVELVVFEVQGQDLYKSRHVGDLKGTALGVCPHNPLCR